MLGVPMSGDWFDGDWGDLHDAYHDVLTAPEPPQTFWPDGCGNPPKCVGCLVQMDTETYFKLDYVCIQCDADWNLYPWQTTHGGSNV